MFDVYYENSLNNAERGNRSTGKLLFKLLLAHLTLSNGVPFSQMETIKQLIRFLIIGDTELYVAFDEQYICIKANGSRELIEDLERNEEESNTRMLLAAQHICHSTENLIIHTPDTDVLIIGIGISTEIPGNLFIRTGSKSNTHNISIEKVKQSLMLCELYKTQNYYENC